MTWTKQTDHAGDALSLLLSQYDNSPRIRGLIAAFMKPIQDLEDQVELFLTKLFDVDGAEGAQLDRLGWIVGEKRRSRSDGTFRAFIRARVLVNRSTGKADHLLRIVRMILGRTVGSRTIRFIPRYPAGYRIRVTGGELQYPWDLTVPSETIATDIADLLEQATSVGVKVAFHWMAAGDTNTFTFASGATMESSASMGMATDDRVTGGQLSDVEQR